MDLYVASFWVFLVALSVLAWRGEVMHRELQST
jgi:hypothetical protein